jgi:hypothetical protein
MSIQTIILLSAIVTTFVLLGAAVAWLPDESHLRTSGKDRADVRGSRKI